MKSNAQGNGQAFCRPEGRGYQAGTGTGFSVVHDDAWNDYEVSLERDHIISEIRLDPCTGPGTVQIDWIRLNTAAGALVKQWAFDGK